MSTKRSEQIRSTPEGRRLVERERVWMEAVENLCRAMHAENVTQIELAQRLGVPTARLLRQLGGEAPLTLGDLSDAAHAMGRSLHVSFGPATDVCRMDQP